MNVMLLSSCLSSFHSFKGRVVFYCSYCVRDDWSVDLASGCFRTIQEKVSPHLRPWHRSFQFWVRAADIYTGYKVFQVRVSLVKDVQKQEAMWERQHELAADKIYAMCSDLAGFFLKVAQIIGKPDLAPAAWVKKLVTLSDQATATPFDALGFSIM
ncbi:hypothetical protein CRYUN_Cryun07bG0025600 [Craigia yunnanensis]